MKKKTEEKRAEFLKREAIDGDLGCVEGDAVPARGGRLRLGLLEEGDGGVVELCEFQRLPPPLTANRKPQENSVISFCLSRWAETGQLSGAPRSLRKGSHPKTKEKIHENK
jgi:hypothetical protein